MVSGRPNLVYSPGPGLWALVLGPFGPDLGPDLDLTWDLDLDLSLTININNVLCPENGRKASAQFLPTVPSDITTQRGMTKLKR